MPGKGKKNHGAMSKGHSRQFGTTTGGKHRNSGAADNSAKMKGQYDASSGRQRHTYTGRPPVGGGPAGRK